MSKRAELWLACGKCGSEQVIDLNTHKEQMIDCVSCGAKISVLDPLKQAVARIATSHTAKVQTTYGTYDDRRKKSSRSGGCATPIVILSLMMLLGVAGFAIALTENGADLFQDVANSVTGNDKIQVSNTLRGHSDTVSAVVYSPDGRYLASGSHDYTVRLWDMATNSSVVLTGSDASIEDLKFSPDGKILAAVNHRGIVMWEIPSGKSIAPKFADYYFSPGAISFSPDGKHIAIADSDTAIWEVATGEQVQLLDVPSTPDDILFSPDGKYVATISWSRGAILWEVGRGIMVKQIGDESGTEVNLSFSADSNLLAFSGREEIWIYDIAADSLKDLKSSSYYSPRHVMFSPDGQYIAADDYDGIRIWDVVREKQIYLLEGAATPIYDFVFSPDGSTVSAAINDGTVSQWIVFADKKQELPAQSSPTPGKPTCMISAQTDARLYNQPGTEQFRRTLRQGFSAEVDGYRSLDDIRWWHLTDGSWVRSDFVQAEPACDQVEQMR